MSVATLHFFLTQTKSYAEAEESMTVIDGHREKCSNRTVSSYSIEFPHLHNPWLSQ